MKPSTGAISSAITSATIVVVSTTALSIASAAETIRIGIGTQDATINTAHGGILVRELKLLEKHLPRTGKYAGVEYDIVWKNFTSGPPLNGEMLAGKLDIGALGDFPAVLNGVTFAKSGGKSVYVTALSGSALGAGNGLVVPADSPAQSLRDLKGKQISVPFGSAAHAMLLRAIRDLGWDPDKDVTLVSQSPEVGGSALKSHKVDGHANFVPFAELFPFRGYARKIYDGSTVKSPTVHGLVARGEFAEKYPEVLTAYLAAVIEADKLIEAEPEKMSELISKISGVDAEVVYMFHGPHGIQTRDFTLKPEVRKSLQIALETLTLLKRTDGTVDLATWVDDRYIRAAAKQSGVDYGARLARTGPTPLAGKDARTGQVITDAKLAAEIWVTGEPKMRRFASVGSAFAALGELAKQGQAVRVTLVHDRTSGLKLLADKVWYVLGASKKTTEAKKAAAPAVAAFLTKDAAEAWAKDKGGTLADFATAKGAAVTALAPGGADGLASKGGVAGQ